MVIVMKFIETRGNDDGKPEKVSFSQAILSPIASFGGLYVPESLPKIDKHFLENHLSSNYKELALDVLKLFDIDIDQAILESAVSLYDHFDDPAHPVPVVKIKENLFVSELYHGPTRAFKDMALQPFGVILSAIAKARQENYLILTATSGDTGPAALETFNNKENIQVACMYPSGGTSDVQRLQMVTVNSRNLKVIGINGDFADAQSALKSLLSSNSFISKLKQEKVLLSAANSVNFGRIIFQIIYHIYSYLELLRQQEIVMDEKVYLNVPSGNFGNALGGYYAMKMGLAVENILIASNSNNVLTKLVNDGKYDIRGLEVKQTSSPAMDILKSSNVERVLYDLYGAERTKELMSDLENGQYYQLSADEHKQLQQIFMADFCEDDEGKSAIKNAFDDGYLMDPHTATCIKTYETCAKKDIKTIVYSTAEWTKFSPTIANALTGEKEADDQHALTTIAQKAKLKIPSTINALFSQEVTQSSVIDKENIEKEIVAFVVG